MSAGKHFCSTAAKPPASGPGCPATHPVACGGECCLKGADCTSGRCGCPEKRAECGTFCCGEGAPCESGTCKTGPACPDPTYPTECGPECCQTGFPCKDGRCACAETYPVECGIYCCLPGAGCDPSGMWQCGCPAGRAACGMADLWCCDVGQECVDNRCVAGPGSGDGKDSGGGKDGGGKDSGGGGSCAGGWMGSTARFGAVGMADECVQSGTLSVCISRTEFESATGLPLPSSCTTENGTGCVNDAGILANPCCPGLACVYRTRCGGGGATGGVCKNCPDGDCKKLR